MLSDDPRFEIVGDLSDEAIEALAGLLLSLAEPKVSIDDQNKARSQEDTGNVRSNAG